MSYRELLKRYRAGELDPQQEAAVREDIEKQDAISEYLCDEGDIPALDDMDALLPETDENNMADEIHKAIRRAFVKAGVIVGAGVLAVVLFVMLAMPHIADRFYYDPTEATDWNYVLRDHNGSASVFPLNRIQVDMGLFSDLFIPCRYKHTESIGGRITAVSEGWGKYSVNIPRESHDQMYTDYIWGRIDRGRLTFSDPNYYQLPWTDCFLMEKKLSNSRKTSFYNMNVRSTAQLEPDTPYSCYVTLKEPCRISEVYDRFVYSRYSILSDNSAWAEAWIENANGENISQGTGIHMSVKYFENEKYPHIRANAISLNDESISAVFADTLRYARDCPEFGLMLFQEGSSAYRLLNDPERMDEIISSVEENGLMVKRFVVQLNGSKVKKLDLDDRVECMEVLP